MLRAGSTPDTYIRRRSLSTSCPVQAFGKRKVRRRQHSRLGTVCSFRPGPFTLIGTPAQPTDSVSWNLSWLKKTRDDLSPNPRKTRRGSAGRNDANDHWCRLCCGIHHFRRCAGLHCATGRAGGRLSETRSPSPIWHDEKERDDAGEPGQLVRLLGIKSGMTVADIGAGSGYYVVRLSPVVGSKGRIIAEDIVPKYLQSLRARVRKLG